MAKLFVGLAIAVMLAAAVLGFLAKGNIDKLQSVLKETKQTLATTDAKLRKTEAELKKTQEDLTSANAKIEAQGTEITGLKKDKDELGKELAEAKSALESKTADLANLQKKLEEVMKGVVGGDPNELAKQIEQQKNDLTKAQAELAEAKAAAENLKKASDAKDEQLAITTKEVNRYRANVARNGLTGRILAVNPGWNFIVLSVGDKQGAATGATMIVVRNGEAIGKARITSVEPSTSIADVLPNSFRKGVTVQPGDTVVYEGQRAAKPADAAATVAPGLPQP